MPVQILVDAPASYSVDPRLVDKALGYVYLPEDVNQILGDLRAINEAFFGDASIDSLRVNNAAGAANAAGDDLVIGTTTGSGADYGMTILSDDAGEGYIFFGGASNTSIARIAWDNVNDRFNIIASTGAYTLAAGYFRTTTGATLGLTGSRWPTVYANALVVTNTITWDAAPTYTPTNVVTDRAYDANATTVEELADILGTLIADLQTLGILA